MDVLLVNFNQILLSARSCHFLKILNLGQKYKTINLEIYFSE